MNDGDNDSTASQYTGNGYLKFESSDDTAVWEIYSSVAGQTKIYFRYLIHSGLSSSGFLAVYVNDNIVNSEFEFHYFGTHEWEQSDKLEITLVAGINKIKI